MIFPEVSSHHFLRSSLAILLWTAETVSGQINHIYNIIYIVKVLKVISNLSLVSSVTSDYFKQTIQCCLDSFSQ